MEFRTLEDYVGHTPLVRLKRIHAGRNNVILAKLEGNNPAGSVKDRPALSMVMRAEARGEIKPGDTLIEATSGNTGIALAMAAAMRGYRMILVMPENQSIERRQTMRAFGAELVLVPNASPFERDKTAQRDMLLAQRVQETGVAVVFGAAFGTGCRRRSPGSVATSCSCSSRRGRLWVIESLEETTSRLAPSSYTKSATASSMSPSSIESRMGSPWPRPPGSRPPRSICSCMSDRLPRTAITRWPA